jgi:hypothetical protein
VTGTAAEQGKARVAIKQQELAAIIGFYGQYSKEAIAAEKAILDEQRKDAAQALKEQQLALKTTANAWMSFGKQIGATFDQTFSGLMRGTQTFAQTFQNMTLSLLNDFAKTLISMGIKFAVHEGLKNGLLSAGLATRLGLQQAADTTGQVAKTAQAVGQVTSDASVGAAGAASAVAMIPIVGPSLAPAAAATTFAEIMGFMSGAVASAAGGYSIPAGVNPLTQLHAQEMVLPAELADKVRSGAGGGDTHNHFAAMDVKSFHDYVQQNHGAISAAVKKATRMGGLTLTPAGVLR